MGRLLDQENQYATNPAGYATPSTPAAINAGGRLMRAAGIPPAPRQPGVTTVDLTPGQRTAAGLPPIVPVQPPPNQSPQQGGFLGTIKKIGNFLRPAYNAVNRAINPVANIDTALNPVVQPILDKTANTETGKRILETVARETSGTSIASRLESLRPDITYRQAYNSWKTKERDPSNNELENFLYGVADSAPQTALGVALSFIPYAGKPLAYTYWSALSAEEQIQQKGRVDNIESIGIDTIGDAMLGNSLEALFKAPAKSLVQTLGQSFLTEGGTESMQTLLKYASDYKQATTPEQRSAALAGAKQYITSGDILREFAIGGTSGALIGAPAHFISGAQGVGPSVQPQVQPERAPEAPPTAPTIAPAAPETELAMPTKSDSQTFAAWVKNVGDRERAKTAAAELFKRSQAGDTTLTPEERAVARVYESLQPTAAVSAPAAETAVGVAPAPVAPVARPTAKVAAAAPETEVPAALPETQKAATQIPTPAAELKEPRVIAATVDPDGVKIAYLPSGIDNVAIERSQYPTTKLGTEVQYTVVRINDDGSTQTMVERVSGGTRGAPIRALSYADAVRLATRMGTAAPEEVAPYAIERPLLAKIKAGVMAPFGSSEKPMTRAEFVALGPGHKAFANGLERLAREGALLDEDVPLFYKIWAPTKDAYLVVLSKGIGIGRWSSIGVTGKGGAKIRGTIGAERTRTPSLKLSRIMPGLENVASDHTLTFLHEYGHVGWYTLLSDAEKRSVIEVWNRLGGSHGVGSMFAQGFAGTTRWHATPNPDEFWAESFAEYVLKKYADTPEMRALLEKKYPGFVAAMNRVKTRLTPEEMDVLAPLYEKILVGAEVSTPEGLSLLHKTMNEGDVTSRGPPLTRRDVKRNERTGGFQGTIRRREAPSTLDDLIDSALEETPTAPATITATPEERANMSKAEKAIDDLVSSALGVMGEPLVQQMEASGDVPPAPTEGEAVSQWEMFKSFADYVGNQASTLLTKYGGAAGRELAADMEVKRRVSEKAEGAAVLRSEDFSKALEELSDEEVAEFTKLLVDNSALARAKVAKETGEPRPQLGLDEILAKTENEKIRDTIRALYGVTEPLSTPQRGRTFGDTVAAVAAPFLPSRVSERPTPTKISEAEYEARQQKILDENAEKWKGLSDAERRKRASEIVSRNIERGTSALRPGEYSNPENAPQTKDDIKLALQEYIRLNAEIVGRIAALKPSKIGDQKLEQAVSHTLQEKKKATEAGINKAVATGELSPTIAEWLKFRVLGEGGVVDISMGLNVNKQGALPPSLQVLSDAQFGLMTFSAPVNLLAGQTAILTSIKYPSILPSIYANAARHFSGMRALAMRSGAAHGVTLSEQLENVAMRKAGRIFLTGVGFVPAESVNRMVAAVAGALDAVAASDVIRDPHTSPQALAKARNDLNNLLGSNLDISKAERHTVNIGSEEDPIEVETYLTQDQIDDAANRRSHESQSGFNPKDMPAWAQTSPWGKLIMKLRAISYQQFINTFNKVVGEYRAGNPARATRNILITLLAGVPAAAVRHYIRALHRLINGDHRDEDEELWQEYLYGLGYSTGLGIAMDLVTYGLTKREGLEQFALGPVLSSMILEAPNQLVGRILAQLFSGRPDKAFSEKVLTAQARDATGYFLGRFGSFGRDINARLWGSYK